MKSTFIKMKGNYMDGYKNEFKNDFLLSFALLWVITFIVYAIILMIYAVFKVSYTPPFSKTVLESFLLTIPVHFYLDYRDYKRLRKPEYALFRFKEFKKWYLFNSKKFVFDNKGFGVYYLCNSEILTENTLYKGKFVSKNAYMFPASFVDFIRFTLFVDKEYKKLKKEKENIVEYQAKIKGNENLMRIMTDIQSDIEKVLKDSQNIINEETNKLEANMRQS